LDVLERVYEERRHRAVYEVKHKSISIGVAGITGFWRDIFFFTRLDRSAKG